MDEFFIILQQIQKQQIALINFKTHSNIETRVNPLDQLIVGLNRVSSK
jgi:hypothetical protein